MVELRPLEKLLRQTPCEHSLLAGIDGITIGYQQVVALLQVLEIHCQELSLMGVQELTRVTTQQQSRLILERLSHALRFPLWQQLFDLDILYTHHVHDAQ